MRRGGKSVENVCLEGYEEKAAHKEREVAAKARRSGKEHNRATIE
jgi:hypothetical protein